MTITAMFIYGGYRDVLSSEEGMEAGSEINTTFCGAGELEAAQKINALADGIDNAVSGLIETQNGPGIWHYDVAEKIGEWFALAAYDGLCVETTEAIDRAITLTTEWLIDINE